MAPARGRSPLTLALLTIAVGGLLLGGLVSTLVLTVGGFEPVWVELMYSVTALVYVGAGLVAWWRRPANMTGPLIVAGGIALQLGELSASGVPELAAVGFITGTLILAIAVHLLHAFPSGRLRGRLSIATVIFGYFVCLVLQAPLYLFTEVPGNLLAVANRPDIVRIADPVQAYAGAATMLVTAIVLARRLRRATPQQRRVLAPVYGYGVLAVLSIPLSVRVFVPWLGWSDDTRAVAQLIALAGIPLAFVVGVLRGGFARSRAIEELGAWLSHSTDARQRLTPALARTLGDDSLEMLFWDSERQTYNDPAGRQVALPAPGTGRAFIEFEVEGRKVGAIAYDAMMIGDTQSVRAAGRVAAIALAHERLTGELRASEEEVRRSRVRIVQAGDRERRRIARNLHDGLQVRLVLLAMDAQQVAKDPGASDGTRDAATALRAGIDDAAAELRTLVHEVMPAALIERGLCAATEDLADRVPLRTRLELEVADGTLSPAVESTAYFVVAEGLTNALKHSAATEVEIRLVQSDGRLDVEVSDNGHGGATAGAGSGLRGLADRVDTLGGSFRVESPPGAGTRLLLELPCES
jgi:signal transduction histidine kinase